VRHCGAGMLIFEVPRGMLWGGGPTNRHVALGSKRFYVFLEVKLCQTCFWLLYSSSVRPAEYLSGLVK
jgi:hypothetical protein